MSLGCKKCSSTECVKNGFIRDHQRYKCKQCGCVYTHTKPRGKPPAMKALAVLMYTIGNASFGMIGRILGVSNVSVMKWIKKEAEHLPEPPVSEDATLIQIDEMWHFVNGKKTKFGFGKPMIVFQGEWSPGNWAAVMLQR
jgi:transposase